ncbi:hypothetical protein ACIRPQ_29005 [Streptomyces sp. NPDC101213]|uniref:hypothetical protein n=1 Tax=Streptomyces sp. NPDC101213 TaxID=3366130 RepID=UPI0038083D3F
MTRDIEDFAPGEILARLEDQTAGWLSWHTAWERPQRPYLDDTRLRDTRTNRDSAAKYFQKLHDAQWEPLSGYPGSDSHWQVLCLRDGWSGNMFNSHMRRGGRHKSCHKREFTPLGRIHLRFQVIANRCNPEGTLGRLIASAADELGRALHLEDAGTGPADARYIEHLRTAYRHVQDAQQHVSPDEPATAPHTG